MKKLVCFAIPGTTNTPLWVHGLSTVATALDASLYSNVPVAFDSYRKCVDIPLPRGRKRFVRRLSHLLPTNEILTPIGDLPVSHFEALDWTDVRMFRDVYAIARSSVVVVGNNTSSLEEFSFAFWAYALQVPLVVVSDVLITHPRLSTLATAVTSSFTLPTVVKAFLGTHKRPKVKSDSDDQFVDVQVDT